jgi:hypothetical protein
MPPERSTWPNATIAGVGRMYGALARERVVVGHREP